MKNFKVGAELRKILLADKAVAGKLQDKVFPLVANAGTTFPFLVYKRSAYMPASNKDYQSEMVDIEIAIATQRYDEGVDIADAVANCLNHKQTDIIENIEISNIYEDYQQDTFLQRINIQIELK